MLLRKKLSESIMGHSLMEKEAFWGLIRHFLRGIYPLFYAESK